MSKLSKTREINSTKLDLKIAFALVPLVTLLSGVGIGIIFALQAVTIPMPWLPVLAVVPTVSFVFLMKYYFKKIDCAVKI